MAYATITIPGDGATTLLTVNFTLGVLQNEVVTVRVTGEGTDRAFTWASSNQIQVTGSPAPIGQSYIIRRRTPRNETMVDWIDGESITDTTLSTDQLQALHLIHELFDAIGDDGSGGGGAVTEAPIDGKSYVRKNGNWSDLALEAGSITAFSSRANAEAATIPAHVNVIAVVHSNQVLFYRRFTGTTQAQGYSALKTNAATVYWNPAGAYSPLHWGATGDGVANDRLAFQDMFRFMYGTPASNGTMPESFAGQRPFVVEGHNRVYGISAPLILGNIGTSVDTGMVYNLCMRDMRLKALAGNWDSQMVTNVPKAMILAGWNFANDYSDQYSGIYDVLLDHVTFDMNFLTGATWVCNTYEFTMYECRYQHPGVGKVVCDTSVSAAAQGTRPFGYNTGNGAYTIIRPNIEGLVGESGLSYPGGNTIDTMGTIGIRVYTNDFRIDGCIISGVTTSMDLYGRAGQIYNIHPWSREVRVRPYAHNLMFCNSYLDYTKFILESFSHAFVGMHWILPADTGSDRGVELRASVAGTTGEGLLFSGCTFASESLDIKYTTTGSGTWVGDKARKVTIKGCKYGSTHTIAQIERFEDKHGLTLATGAHWFRTGNVALGETRLVGDTVFIGKDRSSDGQAQLALQAVAGDQSNFQIIRDTGANGATHIAHTGTGVLALERADGSLGLHNGGIAQYTGAYWRVGFNRASAGAAELTLSNATGLGTPSAAFRSFAGPGVEIAAQQSGGWFRINVPAAENAFIINASGNVEAPGDATFGTADVSGRLKAAYAFSVGPRTAIAMSDTTPGMSVSADGQVSVSAGTSTSPYFASRNNAGFLFRAGYNGAAVGSGSTGGGIYINSSAVLSFNTGSDARLKQDLKPINPALIDLFDVYDFEWKNYPGSRAHGVMAQELNGIIPDAVTHWVATAEDEANGETGDSWSVDYSKIVPLLVATVKELRARVAQLEKGNQTDEPSTFIQKP